MKVLTLDLDQTSKPKFLDLVELDFTHCVSSKVQSNHDAITFSIGYSLHRPNSDSSSKAD